METESFPMTQIKDIIIKILHSVHFRPVSLAGKCRLLFGLAILVVLVLALLIPYFWMGKLTDKAALDSGRAVANVYEKHFKTKQSADWAAVLQNADEAKEDGAVKWLPFDDSRQQWNGQLSSTEKAAVERLKASPKQQELIWFDKGRAKETTYMKLVRADKSWIAYQSPDGADSAFSISEPVGVIMVKMPGRGRSRTILLNRLFLIAAGLLAGTGAIVAFYIIAQRVILSPIRHLRAIVNNVSQGNLEVRCGIKTGDEFQRLGDALNEMLNNLTEGQKKIFQTNKQLDAKIKELSERNIELFKANKLKGEFLANMSHEFRTPLNAILGFAEILREKPAKDPAKSKRYAENIIRSGQNLLNMINDLLELAKAEAGKIELHIEKTDINQLCKGLAAFFSPLTEKRRIKVRLNLQKDIPVTKTDTGKVQQILYNLLSNAVKFSPEGGKIEIKAAVTDQQLIRIAVSDTGPGISEADREKIFEKFRQGDGSLTRGQAGTGLGLAISKELANLLSGNIGMESVAGEGATFWLDLPIIAQADEEDAAAGPE